MATLGWFAWDSQRRATAVRVRIDQALAPMPRGPRDVASPRDATMSHAERESARRATAEILEASARLWPYSGPTAQAPAAPPAASESAEASAIPALERPPKEELDAWLRVVRMSAEEGLPAPPSALLAWNDDNDAALTALVVRVRDVRLEAIELPGAFASDPGLHLSVRLRSAIVASATIATWRGRHDVAEDRLEAAWRLADDHRRLPEMFSIDCNTLGALRHASSERPRAWLERLEVLDLRADLADRVAAKARAVLRRPEFMGMGQGRFVRWLPPPARPFAQRVVAIPWSLRDTRVAEWCMDTRATLLAQDPCEPVRPPPRPPWMRLSPDWTPWMEHGTTLLYLGWELENLHAVELTKHVLALRSGLSRADGCAGERFRIVPASGDRVTVVADEPLPEGSPLSQGPSSFTLTARRPAAPVMASAPAR